jgi:hypothetical protein
MVYFIPVKINISQYSNSVRGYKIIIVAHRLHIREIHGKSLLCGQLHNYSSVHIWMAVFLEHLANTSFMDGLNPGLDCAFFWFSFPKYVLVYFDPPSFLLFVPTAHILHSTPSLLISGLTQHDSATPYIHGHTYLYHINIIIHSLLHTSSTPAGRPAAPDPSRWAQLLCLTGGAGISQPAKKNGRCVERREE